MTPGYNQPGYVAITSYTVPKIHGLSDAEALRGAISLLPGVAEVKVNVPARLVQVDYDDERVTSEAIKAAIEAAGYVVQRYSDGKR